MSAHVDRIDDVDMNNSELTFDNLTIFKEFTNIVNLVSNEDLLETLPKAKLKRIKWVPMFNYLKQSLLDDMVQQMNSLWTYENMTKKLEILEKQKEKFSEVNQTLWRPQLGDVKAQLKAHDVVYLNKQKNLLESLAKEYEARVNRLKKKISAKRGYLRAFQIDIQKYQKKNENFVLKIDEKMKNHNNYINHILQSEPDSEETGWGDKGLAHSSEIDNA